MKQELHMITCETENSQKNRHIPSGKGNPYFQVDGMLFVEMQKTEASFQNHLKPDMLLCVSYPLEP